MENSIDALVVRYGPQHRYSTLTELQRAFLASQPIADYTGGDGSKTVSVNKIQAGGFPVLDITDCFFNPKGKVIEAKGSSRYAEERHRIYQALTGDNSSHSAHQLCTYIFKDNSKLQVTFKAQVKV